MIERDGVEREDDGEFTDTSPIRWRQGFLAEEAKVIVWLRVCFLCSVRVSEASFRNNGVGSGIVYCFNIFKHAA